MARTTRMLGCSLLFAVLAASGGDFSAAEQKIFLDPHLRNLSRATTLFYDFHAAGLPESSFDDQVRVAVRDNPRSKGKKTVAIEYFSGARKLSLPETPDAESNPVILYFLEMDVRGMHQRIGGQEGYFRKRIRLALADSAEVRPVEIYLDGRPVKASEVRIRPYRDDPLKERFGRYQDKLYVFTLSDAVPGGVYQLRSEVHASPAGDGAGGGTGAIEESLTFNHSGT